MSVEQINADLESASDREETDAIFKSAYAAGYTLQELGNLVGVTREYIRQRIARPVSPHLMRTYLLHERVVEKQRAYQAKKKKNKKILGLKMHSPALQVPVSTLNELSQLRDVVTEIRGWTPIDDPARQSVKPFGDLLSSTVDSYGLPGGHLERLLGLSPTTLGKWLKAHGYRSASPSQREYQGIYSDPKTRNEGKKPRLRIGAECKRGHLITKQNLGVNSNSRFCKKCRSDLARERYAARKASKSNPR